MARRKTIQRDPFGRLQSEYEEEEEEYGDALLKDGQTLRVPLYMRDGTINPRLTPTQRGKAEHNQQTADAQARQFGLTDALALHRPGFRRNTDAAALERSRQAYADAEAADTNAWKAPATTSTAPDKLECVPDRRATADARAEAYRLYDEEAQNAWRTRR